MKSKVQQFIEANWDKKRPLLLGLSGGPDSLALLVLLHECRVPLHLAHVDHGWREESAEEARKLSRLAQEMGLPIHIKRLDPCGQTNREAACREERLAYFRELVGQLDCQAVILAHHADDLAETALKRVLEGASLACLGGMRECTELDGLTLWRPLLKATKETILSFVSERALQPFDDATNRDERYLRARLRHRILPELAQTFGKEIRGALCTLSEEANELRDYLEFRTRSYLNRFVYSSSEVMIDLNGHELQELELRFIVRKLCEEAGLGTSRNLIHRVVQLFMAGASGKRVEQGKGAVLIERGRRLIAMKTVPDRLFEAHLEGLF